ncbi:MAG: ATP-binding protein [Parachlamydiales bacterium]
MLLKKRNASFVVLRGRRRIGKSRLIEEFGKGATCHLFTGLPPSNATTKQLQIDTFCRQMSRQFGMPPLQTNDWGEVFWHLGQQVARGRHILALDEISWIGSKDPQFLGHLKTAWDLYFSKNPLLILIVCGSVSSWIERNIMSNTGFVGRISLDMHLEELPLSDAVKFWDSCQQRTSWYEIFKVLAVTGGIPRYLEEIVPQRSAEQNIRDLCFQSDGFLYGEFDRIFSDLFSNQAPTYAKILESLAPSASTLSELGERTGIYREATLISHLKDLCQAGFVQEAPTWNLISGKTSKLKRYRLSDNYIRFYLTYILPNRERIEFNLFGSASLSELAGYEGMLGLQFENLVLKNTHALLAALDIQPTDVIRYGPFFQRPTLRARGCQIDLMIQTRYRVLYLCEIKFRKQKVGIQTVRELSHKHKRLSLPRGWSTRSVLVHINGVTDQVASADEIDHVIDFSELIVG